MWNGQPIFINEYPALQSESDLYIWEHILTSSKLTRLVELGTFKGGLAYFFSLHCQANNIQFTTFDILSNECPPVQEYFIQHDILNNPNKVRELIARPGRTLLYCDNGNKPKEVELYHRFLKVNDILAVHDWNTEISQKDIPDNFVMLDYQDEESPTRWFIKK